MAPSENTLAYNIAILNNMVHSSVRKFLVDTGRMWNQKLSTIEFIYETLLIRT